MKPKLFILAILPDRSLPYEEVLQLLYVLKDVPRSDRMALGLQGTVSEALRLTFLRARSLEAAHDRMERQAAVLKEFGFPV